MSALSVRPSHKPQSVLLGPPCVYLCRQVDSKSEAPHHHQTPLHPSIHPSTHLLPLQSPPFSLPLLLSALLSILHRSLCLSQWLCLVKNRIMCGMSPLISWLHRFFSFHLAHLPVPNSCTRKKKHTHTLWECDFISILIHSNNNMCFCLPW